MGNQYESRSCAFNKAYRISHKVYPKYQLVLIEFMRLYLNTNPHMVPHYTCRGMCIYFEFEIRIQGISEISFSTYMLVVKLCPDVPGH